MNVVTLIGLGNIGFRHLQGLGSIAGKIRLNGFDPDPAAIERARAEWARLGGVGSFSTSFDDLAAADVLILATPSRGRLDLMRRVGEIVRPKATILEKVVFTTRAEFAAAAAWAAGLGTAVHVNCPRRLWPVFRALADRTAAIDGPITLTVTDPALGLACNGVHIVDLFQFLVGDRPIRAVEADFGRIFESKRAGFYEIYGRFELATDRGDRLILSVREDDAPGHRIHLATAAGATEVDQATGTFDLGGVLPPVGRPPYQSELTGAVVADLLDRGRCALPSLAVSEAAHGVVIDLLEPRFEAAGIDCRDGLPIT